MNLERIANQIYSLTNIPIYIYYSEEKTQTFQNINVPINLETIIEGNRTQLIENTDTNYLFTLKDFSELSYVSFMTKKRIVVIGPFLEKEVTQGTIRSLSHRLKLINEEYQLVDAFYESLKVLSNEEIDFIYNLISNNIERVEVTLQRKSLEAKNIKTSKKLSLESFFEELEYVKHNYEVEDQFTTIVENGDIEAAKSFQTTQIMTQLPKRAINDSLRNSKTRLTILNTLCNRAAIRGGIDIQLGHQISTNYGISIEAMKSTLDSDRITKEIIIEYATAVNKYSLNKYSKLIKSAIQSIRRNITYSYSLQDLAEDLFVTKEHISRKFKKETGMTVSEYIGYSKVLEAKKLLDTKQYRVSEVSDILAFTNNTYFSKIFKKYTGMSPIAYRNK